MLQTEGDITRLLADIRDNIPGATAELVGLVYAHWHELAEHLLAHEANAHTLQPTALLNEALVRVLQGDLLHTAPNRIFLHESADLVMRHVLVEHARRRGSITRGGEFQRLPFDVLLDRFEEQRIDVVELNDALDALSRVSKRVAKVMTMRLWGYTVAEIADHLGVSASTVEKELKFARGWLRRELGGDVS